MTTRCARCGDLTHCWTWEHVSLCQPCLALIVGEWAIRRAEIGELA